jgi:nitrogen fixation protein FixH
MARSRQPGERGGSKFNLLLTILILGSMGFLGIKILPTYVNNYQFQDSIEAESRFALTGYPKKSSDDVRQDIYKKAQELGLPVKSENIMVVMTNGTVEISVDYSVTFDLSVYQWTHDFHPHADNHTI